MCFLWTHVFSLCFSPVLVSPRVLLHFGLCPALPGFLLAPLWISVSTPIAGNLCAVIRRIRFTRTFSHSPGLVVLYSISLPDCLVYSFVFRVHYSARFLPWLPAASYPRWIPWLSRLPWLQFPWAIALQPQR